MTMIPLLDGPQLSLEHARKIAEAALETAREISLRPMTIAVLDPGGHLVFLVRENGSSFLRPEIAIGKAFTALALGMSSRQVDEMAATRPNFISALGQVSQSGIIPAAGGLLISAAEFTMGAVGVSGDTPDNDEMCAQSGLTALSIPALK